MKQGLALGPDEGSMARQQRVDEVGAYHHVTARGVERRTIFIDDVDILAFLERLRRLLLELGFTCIAWALVINHFHLVVRRNAQPLSKLMARLNGPYAQEFNRRHGRVGHLFQDRFVSRVVRDEADLQGVTRYALFNPARHRVVLPRELPDYRWCGFGAAMGVRAPMDFESVAATLRVFAERPAEARIHLAAKLAELAVEVPLHVRVEEIARVACKQHGIPRDCIGARVSEATAARRDVCEAAIHDLGASAALVARVLGVSRMSVSRALSRASALQRGLTPL